MQIPVVEPGNLGSRPVEPGTVGPCPVAPDALRGIKRQQTNPARWTGHLEHVLPKKADVAKVEHHPSLPYADLPAFMTDLRKREGIAARALEFAILTAARTAEVTEARWDEIILESKTWAVPEGRMKAGKAHRVTLSDCAIKLLESLQSLPREKDNNFVFVGPRGGGLSNAAMAAVIDRMNEARAKAGLPKWTDPQLGGREVVPHGLPTNRPPPRHAKPTTKP